MFLILPPTLHPPPPSTWPNMVVFITAVIARTTVHVPSNGDYMASITLVLFFFSLTFPPFFEKLCHPCIEQLSHHQHPKPPAVSKFPVTQH